MISADTKDALARDVPAASHCRDALLAGLALYGSARGEFVTHRNAVARLFWSLLDERKSLSDRNARADAAAASADLRDRASGAAARDAAQSRCTNAIASSRCARHFWPAVRSRPARAAIISSSSLRGEDDRAALDVDAAQRRRSAKATRRKGADRALLQRFRRDRRAADAHRSIRRGARARRRARAAGNEESHPSPRQHRSCESGAKRPSRGRAAAASSSICDNAYGLARLSPALREVAELRLRHPDESLAELGRRCNPPIAKPTVSSRLGALVRLADHLRGGQVSAKAAR